jgi:NADP-dependent 3-hydroxy acid dehydrogenase YdfG
MTQGVDNIVVVATGCSEGLGTETARHLKWSRAKAVRKRSPNTVCT